MSDLDIRAPDKVSTDKLHMATAPSSCETSLIDVTADAPSSGDSAKTVKATPIVAAHAHTNIAAQPQTEASNVNTTDKNLIRQRRRSSSADEQSLNQAATAGAAADTVPLTRESNII